MTDLKRTPLYDEHVRAGGKMVEFAGYEMPIQYPTGIVAEHRAVRSNAGLFDLSHMGEFFFTGDAAGAAIDAMVASDIGALTVGQARYGLLTNERGTIVDDAVARVRIEAEAARRAQAAWSPRAVATALCDAYGAAASVTE